MSHVSKLLQALASQLKLRLALLALSTDVPTLICRTLFAIKVYGWNLCLLFYWIRGPTGILVIVHLLLYISSRLFHYTTIWPCTGHLKLLYTIYYEPVIKLRAFHFSGVVVFCTAMRFLCFIPTQTTVWKLTDWAIYFGSSLPLTASFYRKQVKCSIPIPNYNTVKILKRVW